MSIERAILVQVRKGLAALLVSLLSVPVGLGACGDDHGQVEGPCADYLDDELESVRVVIENARTTPVFFTAFDFCTLTVDFAVEDEAGVSFESRRDECGGTCAMLVNGFGCGGGGCGGDGLGMLPPGFSSEVFWQPWQLDETEVPDECVYDDAADRRCVRQVSAPPGTYTLTVSASFTARCGSDNKPCLCTPTNGSTSCAVFDDVFSLGEEVTFTATVDLPTDGEQELHFRIE